MTNGAVETTVDGAAVVVERTANPQLPTTMTPPVAATASSNTSTSRSSSSSSSTQTGKKNHPIVATNTTDPATTVDATTATTPNTTTTTRSTGRTPTSFNPRASQPPLPPAQQQQPPPNTETSPTPDANDGSSNASANNNNNINNNNNNNNNNNEDWVTSTSQAFEETIARPASEALHSFFYPPVREREVTSPYRASHASIRQRDDEEDDDDDDDEGEGEEGRNHNHAGTSDQGKHRRRRRKRPNRRAPSSSAQSNGPPRGEFDEHFHQQQLADRAFVERFWTAYDDVIILSLFTQVGIVARLGVSTWFTFFDGVFSNDSPLFVNLPLNCLSCFLLGLLCSGASLMEIIMTRFSPPRLQQALHERQLEARRNNKKGHDDANDDHANKDYISSDDSEDFPIRDMQILSDDEGVSSDDGVVRLDGISPTSSFRWNPLRNRRRRRRTKRRSKWDRSEQPNGFWWEPPVRLDEELRDVQLLALERRIRQSKCLLLFPLKKEDVDVMEHYFNEGYRKNNENDEFDQEEDLEHNGMERDEVKEEDEDEDADRQEIRRVVDARLALENDLALVESEDPELDRKYRSAATLKSAPNAVLAPPVSRPLESNGAPNGETAPAQFPSHDGVELHGEQPPSGTDINQMVNEVSANVTEKISRLRRANLADGWDVGTTPEAMSDDLMLGLRLGFCGALSSFSSWNSAMINLIRDGHIGEAITGYMLGIQLPIVAYRFGQHVAVYCFIWRCRQETKRDERRGYGIRVAMNESSERDDVVVDADNGRESSERETPSVRAVATALFVMALVTQSTSIYFYNDPESQVVALSLLFSPLGVIARWRLTHYNNWRPTFPIGTFCCNILAVGLSGGLGNLIEGNPDEAKRILLVSFINGFGGTLSSVAAFIVEILAGIDPVLLRVDGAVYALLSIFWALVVGFIFTASADWADETG